MKIANQADTNQANTDQANTNQVNTNRADTNQANTNRAKLRSTSAGRSKLNILYEDESIIVVHKPAGTATQSRQIRTPDMTSLIKTHLPAANKSAPYLAVIHRLDQPVEGILVFAKSPAAAKNLSGQLTKGDFTKKYRALISAQKSPKEKEGTLTDYLKKDKNTNLSKICDKSDPEGKFCRLQYWVSEDRYFNSPEDLAQTELEILLDTGRHHQIRLQLSKLGCPILGDKKYGDPFAANYSRTLKLCAFELSFRHPKSGKELHFCLM